MGMQAKYLDDFYVRVSQDETIVRYLSYKPKNALDDPLSPTKPNIVGTDRHYTVLDRNIIPIAKNNDLDNESLCRICMYLGTASRTSNNKVYRQRLNIDVFVHIESFEKIDNRSTRIIARLNKLLVGRRITGMGKVQKIDSSPITAPPGYIAFTNVYSFWSTS